jgi:uncharacterized surface protein with fasciclin (FAS1) repeats
MRTANKIFGSIFLTLSLAILAVSCQKEPLTPGATTQGTPNIQVSDRNNTIVDIAVSNPDFSSLVAAVLKTDLAGFLSNAGLDGTVFAPTNDAFAQLPAPFNNAANISNISDPTTINTLRQIIKYHVGLGRRSAAQLTNGSYKTYYSAPSPDANLIYVGRNAGNEVFINGNSKVVAADVNASNGIIHVINKVLFYPNKDIVQIARGNGNFKALIAALRKTGLTNLLSQPIGNFTVFAPTDAAFAALPAPLNNAANIATITDPATITLLSNVLKYHLIGARVFSADLREGITAPTALAGNSVGITLATGPKVKGSGNTNGSNIVLTDLLAVNGVIHVIDQVLLP